MQHWFRMVHDCITTHAHQEELDYNQHQTLINKPLFTLFSQLQQAMASKCIKGW